MFKTGILFLTLPSIRSHHLEFFFFSRRNSDLLVRRLWNTSYWPLAAMVTRYDFLFSKSLALSTNKPPFIRLLYTGNFFCNFFFQFNQRYKLLAIQIESPNCNTSRCNSRVTAIKFPRKRKPCYFNLHSGQTFHRKGHFPSENINLIFR